MQVIWLRASSWASLSRSYCWPCCGSGKTLMACQSVGKLTKGPGVRRRLGRCTGLWTGWKRRATLHPGLLIQRPSVAAGRDWSCYRHRRLRGDLAGAFGNALWDQPARSGRIRGRLAVPRGRGFTRELCASTASHQGRPHGCAAL